MDGDGDSEAPSSYAESSSSSTGCLSTYRLARLIISSSLLLPKAINVVEPHSASSISSIINNCLSNDFYDFFSEEGDKSSNLVFNEFNLFNIASDFYFSTYSFDSSSFALNGSRSSSVFSSIYSRDTFILFLLLVYLLTFSLASLSSLNFLSESNIF